MNGTPGAAGGTPGQRGSTWWIGALAVIVGLVLLSGLVGAVVRDQLSVTKATALFLLGSITLAFTAGFSASVRGGDWPRLETSWGGLGGGLGGWRLSPALACLLGALLFGGAFTTASMAVQTGSGKEEQARGGPGQPEMQRQTTSIPEVGPR